MWTDGHLRAWESRLAQATWTSRGYMGRDMKVALAVVAVAFLAGLWGMFG